MEILYQDQEILVFLKPVGMDSEHQLPRELEQQVGGKIYPLHRLDVNVGGVMVAARTPQAAAELSQMIQNGGMVKEYVAQVHGTPPEAGDWEDLLFKDSRKNKVFVVNRPRAGVKPARLRFQRLTEGDYSLVHIRLYTGRSHQIRAQFSSRGYPLVGDHKYGSRSTETTPKLFSCRISFPYRKEYRTFESYPDWVSEETWQSCTFKLDS